MDRTTDREGQALHYQDMGGGERCVLLAHNLLCSREVFAHHAQALAGEHRVLNVDLRGHGASQRVRGRFDVGDVAEDLRAVLDDAGVERAVVAGVSLGATAALELALAHPSRVEGLVLFGATGRAATRFDSLQNTALAGIVRALGWVGFVRGQAAEALFGASFRAEEPEKVARWRDELSPSDGHAVWQGIRAWCRRPDLLSRVGAISAPTLLVSGEEDTAHPPVHGEELQAALPSARLERLAKAGHSMTFERPVETLRLLSEFLAQPPEDP